MVQQVLIVGVDSPFFSEKEKWGQGLIYDLIAFTCLAKFCSSAIFFLMIATLRRTDDSKESWPSFQSERPISRREDRVLNIGTNLAAMIGGLVYGV